MTPDADAIFQIANTYPAADYRAEIQSEIYLRVATGTPLEEAARAAFAWADRQRREERGRISLDALLSEYGDALRYLTIAAPPLSLEAQYQRRRADGKATPRVPERGIAIEECELTHLVSVLQNLVERGIVEVDPQDFAVDLRALPVLLRRAVLAVCQSATRAEMGEAGISGAWIRAAAGWLGGYGQLREHLI